MGVVQENVDEFKSILIFIIILIMNNISIKCIKSEAIESGVCYGEFVINDLKPGQGITIGNQLRRVLLGDLGGTAISAVRIAGIGNEFSTIPGVREDILEILLNLKGIILKTKNETEQFGRLKVQGPVVVTADLIQLPENYEIVNPNHYIATISTSNVLEIEFKFEYGTGYKLSSHTSKKEEELENFLELDRVYMPVQKVDFKIKTVYDTEHNISERLFLDIWTNGSISPEEAIEKASQIIIDLFTKLINNDETKKVDQMELQSEFFNIEPYTNIAIEELQLSIRAYNCLKKAHIHTVADLLKYSPEDLQKLKNFGRKSADEVFSTLKTKFGIILK